MIKVEIREYERGWGNKVDAVKEFDTLEEAQEFCKDFNSVNDSEYAPDWYMAASII